MIHGHGGNIYAMARQLGCRPDEIIDLSSNINPLGMPPGLMPYLHERLGTIGALPEVDSRTAVAHIATLLDVHPDRILAGNGTTQFIYNVCAALDAKKVLIVGPTYSDYADACRIDGIAPNYFLADPDHQFELALETLGATIRDHDTVLICNPNNPTGGLIPHAELMRLCQSHPKTRFIIDESYLPFVPADQSQSMVAAPLDNVGVLWSLSKIFGIPGIRAGFFIGSGVMVSRFRHYLRPWSLNSLAQAAVEYLGRERDAVAAFASRTRIFLEEERHLYSDRLSSNSNLTVFPSLTSYMLIRLPDHWKAVDICHQMAQDRFLIRNCDNFHGLSDQYVRVALKDPETNIAAADSLAALSLSMKSR